MTFHSQPLAVQPALGEYEGIYQRPPVGTVEVRRRGEHLVVVTGANQPDARLTFYGPDIAYAVDGPYVGMPYEFIRDRRRRGALDSRERPHRAQGMTPPGSGSAARPQWRSSALPRPGSSGERRIETPVRHNDVSATFQGEPPCVLRPCCRLPRMCGALGAVSFAQAVPEVKLPPSPTGQAAVQLGGRWEKTAEGGQRYRDGKWLVVDYSRPLLRGRKDIFGAGADYGKLVNGDATIWRVGANDTTRLTAQAPLQIGGKTVPAACTTCSRI